MLVTYYDAYSVLTKVYGNGAYIKQALSSTIIEEKNRSATTKICYGVLDKDITLTYIIKKLSPKNPKLPIRILLKIALYALIYLKTANHAVINTTVELVKKLGKGGTSGFVNAVLRNYLRNPVALPSGCDAYSLSIKYSYPEFLAKKLIDSYGESLASEIISYDTETSYVRFKNGFKGEEYLSSNKINYEKTPFNNLFSVKGFSLEGGFYEGLYTFQSIGSVAICEGVLSPSVNDIVENNANYYDEFSRKTLLDSCSAPGGKAVYLSDYFNQVTACDLHEHRVELIKSYASRMNKTNITPLNLDSSVLNEEFIEKFDYVLVDAPCSGTGVIKENPDIKLNRNNNSILELTATQIKILNNNAKYVKKGGYLCYSTCSVLKEENYLVVSKFLSQNPNFTPCKVDSKLNNLNDGLGLQFLPNISMGAGFYFVKLKRN